MAATRRRLYTRYIVTRILAACLLLSAGTAFSLDAGFIEQPNTVVNVSAALTQSVQAGSVQVEISGAIFTPGQRVVLVQSQSTVPTATSTVSAFQLSDVTAGRFEFNRVVSVFGTIVRLETPVAIPFAAPGAQLVSVAEYDSLTIGPDGGLVVPPWDGARGGVLALSVQGAFVNDGIVSASGGGFRGGGVIGTAAFLDGGACLESDGPAPYYSGGGEGVGLGTYQRTSRDDAWGGGGAGSCIFGGGGGGSNAGSGGPGGNHPAPDTGNYGKGARLLVGASLRLILGGGGGGGHYSTDYASAVANGGSGGGIILVQAGSIGGSGVFLANGVSPRPFGGGDWGYGGGGAGGTVWLSATGSLACGRIEAQGANGGTGANYKGPGGGGGGGRVVLEAGMPLHCPALAQGGVGGVAVNNSTLGAGPSSGTVVPFVGEVLDVAPPMDVADGGTPGALHFTSTPNALAYCGVPYRYGVNLVPQVEPAGAMPSYAIEPIDDQPLPVGLSVAPGTGEVVWRPSSEQTGTHRFQLVARWDGLEDRQPMEVHVECERPKTASVGCAAAPGWLALALVGLWLRRSQKR